MASGNKNDTTDWAQAAQQFQQNLVQQWTQLARSFPGVAGQAVPAPDVWSAFQAFMPPAQGAAPMGMPALNELFQQAAGTPASFDPATLLEIQQNYLKDAVALWNQGLSAKPEGDRRFAADAWAANPVSAFTAATYLLNARTLMTMAEAVQGDAKTRARVRFAVQQWIDASAPSNFLAFNAEAQKKAIETQGESIAKGVANLLHDIKQGHVSMTDESVFEVGRNVATTEGAVVFENELFQLIEYKPLTAKVYERPFLLVPPCINKFYILDLQPENSLIRYAVEQGHRTFVVSWRNPDESLAKTTWDQYIEDAVIKAIDVVRDISGAEDINALGFCVGGTMLGTALAVLAARGQQPVHSATFLTTLLDFSDTGILDVFIDENFVQFREMQFNGGGLMPGRDLATTFSFLRPNDLVWNYVQSNYLKGNEPPAFDLLYWNADSTNLPGPMFCWYLRNCYLENNLKTPGKLTIGGVAVDLGAIEAPTFIFGSKEDHIVPWTSAYASMHVLNPGKPKQNRFILGASGHIAGVINPASKNKRSYWSNDAKPKVKGPALDADAWFEGATEHKGSWWPQWAAFLAEHGGREVAAPSQAGTARYRPIEDAPGRYVKARAD